jgi:phosphatidate cytidylyltransferase
VLKQRVLSALIMVPLVVAAVLYLKPAAFALAVMAMMLVASWEWGGLIPLHGLYHLLAYILVTGATIAGAWYLAGQETFVNALLWLAMAWWLFVLFWLSRPALGGEISVRHTVMKAVLGVGLMVSTWLALVVLHSRPDQGPHWVLYVLVLVWVADSGAFFVGKTMGRHKLAPQVSPGKTWEGVFGALVATGVFAFGYGRFLGLEPAAFSSFVLVCLVTVLFSIAGDLLESLMKRQRGVKDSGVLIPGHGGLLDRIDSLLAAAPVFVFGMRWVGL